MLQCKRELTEMEGPEAERKVRGKLRRNQLLPREVRREVRKWQNEQKGGNPEVISDDEEAPNKKKETNKKPTG